MLRAVVEARRHRYLMLNAPESALDEISGSLGSRVAERAAARGAGHGRGARARPHRPTSGGCCPQLEAAGGSSILVVPVERMAA